MNIYTYQKNKKWRRILVMTRSVRQSKILDIISAYEIETQEDLVNQLRAANFDVTQATISRDIKELGLIKILSSDSNKYKYAIVDATEKQASNKYLYLFCFSWNPKILLISWAGHQICISLGDASSKKRKILVYPSTLHHFLIYSSRF